MGDQNMMRTALLAAAALLAVLCPGAEGQVPVATPGITAGLPKPLVSCYFNGTADGCDGFLLPGMDASNQPSGFLPKFLQPDDTWSEAFSCVAPGSASLPLPTLAPLSYGSGGPFAISMWFKWSNSSFGSNQFLFSQVPSYKLAGDLPSLDTPSGTAGANPGNSGTRHLLQVPQASTGAAAPTSNGDQAAPPARSSKTPIVRVAHIGSALSAVGTSALMPNQVQVFLPSGGDPGVGVVRSLVRDSTDLGSAPTFLDSDGMINNFDGIRNDPFNKQVQEGDWHHLVVSTLPQVGKKGYVIYLDGAPTAALSASSLPVATNNAPNHISVTGGGPLSFEGGAIFFCQGADRLPESRFQGYISHMRIFNASLTASQVTSLYMDDVSSMTTNGQAKYTAQLSTHAASRTDSLEAALQPGAVSGSNGATGNASAPVATDAAVPGSSTLNAQQRQQAEIVSDPTAGAGNTTTGALPDSNIGPPASTSDTVSFSLVNGEVTAGLPTQGGMWAPMVVPPSIANIAAQTAGNVTAAADSSATSSMLFAACDGSYNSNLAMPLDMDQLLPVTGFSTSVWLRLPLTASITASPLPIFSVITTQQATVASIMEAQARQQAALQAAQAANAHSAARQQPGTTQGRRMQQTGSDTTAPQAADPGANPDSLSSALLVPLSTHAYLVTADSASSNVPSANRTTGNSTAVTSTNSTLEVHVAVNVAVIPNAAPSFPGENRAQPFVETYQAVVSTSGLLDGAMHHLALVASPSSTGSTSGRPRLTYNVYVDGQPVASATPTLSEQPAPTLSSAPTINATATNTTGTPATFGIGAGDNAWLLNRALPQLQDLAASGHTGLFLACGAATDSTVSAQSTSGAGIGVTAVSTGHQRRLAGTSSTIVRRLADGQSSSAAAGNTASSGTQGSVAPPPITPGTTSPSPPLAPHPESVALVTDLRLFQSSMTGDGLQALYQNGPGPGAGAGPINPALTGNNAATVAGQQTTNDTSTPGGLQTPAWVQVGTGFVPKGSALDPTGNAAVLKTPSTLPSDLPSQSSNAQPAVDGNSQPGMHMVTTVLPEDLENKTITTAPHIVTTVLPEDLQQGPGNDVTTTTPAGTGTGTNAALTAPGDGSDPTHAGVVAAGHPMNVVLPEDLQGKTRLQADQASLIATPPSSSEDNSHQHAVAMGVGLGVGLGGAFLIALVAGFFIHKKGQQWAPSNGSSVLSWVKNSGAARSQRSIASTIQLPVTTQHQLRASSEILVRSVQDHAASLSTPVIPGSCSLPIIPGAPAFATSVTGAPHAASYSVARNTQSTSSLTRANMDALTAQSFLTCASSSHAESSPASVITISPSLATGAAATSTITAAQAAPPPSVLVLPSSTAPVSATGYLGSPSMVTKRTPRTLHPGSVAHPLMWHNTIDEEDVPGSAAEGSQRAKRSLEMQAHHRPTAARSLATGGLRSSLQGPRPEPMVSIGATVGPRPPTTSGSFTASGNCSGSSISLRATGLPIDVNSLASAVLTPRHNRTGHLSNNALGLCLSPRGHATLPASRMAPARSSNGRAKSFVSAGLSGLGMCVGGAMGSSSSISEHLLASTQGGNSTGTTSQAAPAQKTGGRQDQALRELNGQGQVVVGGVDKTNLTHRHHTAPSTDKAQP